MDPVIVINHVIENVCCAQRATRVGAAGDRKTRRWTPNRSCEIDLVSDRVHSKHSWLFRFHVLEKGGELRTSGLRFETPSGTGKNASPDAVGRDIHSS